MTVPIRCIHSA